MEGNEKIIFYQQTEDKDDYGQRKTIYVEDFYLYAIRKPPSFINSPQTVAEVEEWDVEFVVRYDQRLSEVGRFWRVRDQYGIDYDVLQIAPGTKMKYQQFIKCKQIR